jgi:hypothetical protein
MMNENEPMDALKRFLVFIERAGTNDFNVTDEDRIRLEEAMQVLLCGNKLATDSGVQADFAVFLSSLFQRITQESDDENFSVAVKMIDMFLGMSKDMEAAYMAALKFAFDLGLGFGAYEYQEKEK